MSALLRQYLWIWVVVAVVVGVVAAMWLAGVAAGPPVPRRAAGLGCTAGAARRPARPARRSATPRGSLPFGQ